MDFNLEQMLTDLEEIATTVRSDAETGSEARSLARMLNGVSAKLGDYSDMLTESVDGLTSTTVDGIASALAEWASVIGPKSPTQQWTQEKVNEKLAVLTNLASLGDDYVTSAQATRIEGISRDLKRGSGVRGPRSETEVLPNRPDFVVISVDGREVARRSGNRKQSPGNLKAKLCEIFEIDPKSSDGKAAGEICRKVCVDATEELFGDATLIPVFEALDLSNGSDEN